MNKEGNGLDGYPPKYIILTYDSYCEYMTWTPTHSCFKVRYKSRQLF